MGVSFLISSAPQKVVRFDELTHTAYYKCVLVLPPLHSLLNKRRLSLALQGTHVCSTFLYHHLPTTNCWWVGNYREEASPHKSLGGPQCPEIFSPPPNAHTPSRKISLPKFSNKGVVISTQPLVQFGSNSGMRHRRSLFRPPSRQRAKVMLFFTEQHLRRRVGGPQCPEFFPAKLNHVRFRILTLLGN